MNKKLILMMILSVLIMTVVDGILQPSYMIKSVVKIFFFLILPLTVMKKDIRPLFHGNKKQILKSLGLGICLYLVILAGYVLMRNFIDLETIRQSLQSSMGVNENNFLWVFTYIALCNSLLEEFFFRGLGYLESRQSSGERTAFVFSALLFSFYHVGMTSGWFDPVILILSLTGLFIGGCLFNLLDRKSGNILNSWIVHMFCNFAINTVGLFLFL